ncbi:DUF397 domain-containing protein [Streptomyces sp. DSM 118878]
MTQASTPGIDTKAAAWFKSSYSGGEGNECVEIAHIQSRVGVRDSKDPRRNALAISTEAFAAFVDGVKAAG